MSGNPNLEHQIGELSGIMQGLVPALERLEARMNAAEKTAAGNAVEVQHMIQQFVAFRDQMTRSIEQFKLKTANEAGRQAQKILRMETTLKTISGEVQSIQKRRDGFWKKAWDVAKLLIAAVLGAVGTKLLH